MRSKVLSWRKQSLNHARKVCAIVEGKEPKNGEGCLSDFIKTAIFIGFLLFVCNQSQLDKYLGQPWPVVFGIPAGAFALALIVAALLLGPKKADSTRVRAMSSAWKITTWVAMFICGAVAYYVLPVESRAAGVIYGGMTAFIFMLTIQAVLRALQ